MSTRSNKTNNTLCCLIYFSKLLNIFTSIQQNQYTYTFLLNSPKMTDLELFTFHLKVIETFHGIVFIGEVVFDGLQPVCHEADSVVHPLAALQGVPQTAVLLARQVHHFVPLFLERGHFLGHVPCELGVALLRQLPAQVLYVVDILLQGADIILHSLSKPIFLKMLHTYL